MGEVVAPSVGGGLTRGAVVTMADLSTLEVEVDVNEAYIGRVQHGQPARITLDAYPDTAFRGSVRQVVPTADRQRATVQVKVSILDHDPRILPEMGARVDFIAASPDTAASGAGCRARQRRAVPAAGRGGARVGWRRPIVWLIRGGKLESRSVEAGPVSAGYREIRRGLTRRRDGADRRRGEAGAGDARGSPGEVVVPRTAPNPSQSSDVWPSLKSATSYKTFTRGAETHRRVHRPDARRGAGQLHRAHGAVGLRQVHAAQPHRGSRQADQRHGAGGRRRGERDDADAARRLALARTSASCSSRSTCCRCSPRSRTSSCRCC